MDADFALGIIDMCDENPKNLLPVSAKTGNAGQSVDISCDIPPGDYVISFQTLSTTHATLTTCRVSFVTAGGQWASQHAQIYPGAVVSMPVTITAQAKTFRVIPASTVGGTAGTDVVSFTGAMVCKKERWAISHAFVPYHPPLSEMWAAIQSLQA